MSGPSPRVRGSPCLAEFRVSVEGSIPACAGKPNTPSVAELLTRVHPRVCGEAERRAGEQSPVAGPSPRVRGSLGPQGQSCGPEGSIPACAGKPRQRRRALASGSIPACAGKPRPSTQRGSSTRVHPRVCGEAAIGCLLVRRPRGPSPRVRGSRSAASLSSSSTGSIPACAGKPGGTHGAAGFFWVHPRVCGEAVVELRQPQCSQGPSPRVRGSPPPVPSSLPMMGSIPACAGKP